MIADILTKCVSRPVFNSLMALLDAYPQASTADMPAAVPAHELGGAN